MKFISEERFTHLCHVGKFADGNPREDIIRSFAMGKHLINILIIFRDCTVMGAKP